MSGGYFQGYVADMPHPRMAATGTEGRCELCGSGEYGGIHQAPFVKPRADDHEADVNDAAGSADLSWAQCPRCKEFVHTGDPHKSDCFVTFTARQLDPSIFADTFEAYRQQGREEVLREIAKLEPTSACDSYCTFCRALLKYHEPDCLWLRAQQAVKT